MPHSAGIVLAGGRSSRMGTPKAALEWHGSTLLRRTTGILSRSTDGPVIVVRAAGQDLPALPPGVEVVDDPHEGLGPLQGIAAGLAAVGGRAPIAFVCSTDLPFLHPAFVRRMLRAIDRQDSTADGDRPAVGLLSPGCEDSPAAGTGTTGGTGTAGESGHGGADVGLPVARGFSQPLAAAYRTALAPLAGRLVAERRLRPAFLFEECTVARLDEAALHADLVLAALDPDFDSVLNVNEPADYQSARARPGPLITIRRSGSLADDQRGPETVRAATVARAAAAAGIALDGQVGAALNGGQLTKDGETPLAAGDTVLFITTDARG
ncbi:MAG TPA: molybdenum cofactor guanylyltransferase [Streptosporangiaceae bacterium]|nr:molybdenum cofactor guanylyltransferase [Streptosporangiaceae bacterium]